MSLVIDSSVVVAALVDAGATGVRAEGILEQDGLYAPEHVRVEAANALRQLERGKEITEQEANASFEELVKLDIELHAFEAFAGRVWELRHNVASYVALAERYSVYRWPRLTGGWQGQTAQSADFSCRTRMSRRGMIRRPYMFAQSRLVSWVPNRVSPLRDRAKDQPLQ